MGLVCVGTSWSNPNDENHTFVPFEDGDGDQTFIPIDDNVEDQAFIPFEEHADVLKKYGIFTIKLILHVPIFNASDFEQNALLVGLMGETLDVTTPQRKLRQCPMQVLKTIVNPWTKELIWLKSGRMKYSSLLKN